MTDSRPPSPTLVEEELWVLWQPIGFSQYDFDFEGQFSCRHPNDLENEITAIARLGSAPDYPQRYRQLLEWNIRLIHSPEEYQRSSLLPHWYPVISDFTPVSRCYDTIPSVEAITADFDFPLFIKGERQTNKHSRDQSIIRSKDQLEALLEQWAHEEILWWQRLVCREYHPLKLVSEDVGKGLPKSFEFRTFWFYGELVGLGRYWISVNYEASDRDVGMMSEIGREVSGRLGVPFLVIDFAKTAEGKWMVIECNDGQDSGYAGVNARKMWGKILECLKARS